MSPETPAARSPEEIRREMDEMKHAKAQNNTAKLSDDPDDPGGVGVGENDLLVG
jgi:hypothetical protein